MPKIKEEKLKQLLWFTAGAICGLAMLSFSKAAVPNIPTGVTDDSAIYQNLSEIRITKENVPSFDGDISRLSRIESRYRDHLPGLSGQARQAYRYRASNRYRTNTGAVSAWNERIPAPSP